MPSSFPVKVTLLLEKLASGKVAASIVEFPQCRVEELSRERAIETLKAAFLERIANMEALTWEVPATEAHPDWLKFAGIFCDDPDFRAIMEGLRIERQSDDESEVDPSYYL